MEGKKCMPQVGIDINQFQVSSRVMTLRRQIDRDLDVMNQRYDTILASLAEMDSKSNQNMQAAVEQNRKKAEASAEVLMGLLSFIEHATEQIQVRDCILSNSFTTVMFRDALGLPRGGS